MKKLLLFLLLSLAFIGSANANSIKGAFGYKLGEVKKSVDITFDKVEASGGVPASFHFYSEQSFIPESPLRGLNKYEFETTFEKKKIHRIAGFTGRESIKGDSCFEGKGNYGFILQQLEARYGYFKRVKNINEFGTTSYGLKWQKSESIRRFTEGERYITLSCCFNYPANEPGKGNYKDNIRSELDWCPPGRYNLSLEYVDRDLAILAQDEEDELERQKIIKLCPDCDI